MSEGSRNPYPGPRPFRADEFSIFAGRDYEISELSSLIISHKVVLLYAQSGAGKTSLLSAGLGFGVQDSGLAAEGSALRRKGVQLLPVARVGIPVPKAVSLVDVRNVYAFSAIGDLLPSNSSQSVSLQPTTLADALAQIPRQKDAAGDTALRVVAFDQFEELFSTYPQRWPDRLGFFDQVAKALLEDSSLRIVFVLREDYLAEFGAFAEVLPEGARTRYHLERLREAEALLAIERPLRGTRWSFAEGVAQALVKDLMTVTVESHSGELVSVSGEFVEPVQLQVVCYSLFERIPQDSTKITMDDLKAFGNPNDALQSFYERAIALALEGATITEGQLRSWFKNQLVTPAGTRGLVFRDRDVAGGIPNSVVDVLESQHLIRPELRSGSRWYELAHDRFLEPIYSSNKKWREEKFNSLASQSVDMQRKIRDGMYEDALRSCNELLSISKDIDYPYGVALAFAYRGDVFWKQGQAEQATLAYIEAVENAKVSGDRDLALSALLGLSAVWFNLEKYEDAVNAASEAIDLAPRNSSCYRQRAAACWYSERYEEALRDYNFAIDLSPENVGGYNGRGHVLAEMGEYAEAIPDLDRSISLSANDPILRAYSHNGRALAYAGLGEFKKALKEFERSLELCPDNAWAYYNRALTYDWMRKPDRALDDFKVALEKKNPALSPLKRRRAKARLRRAKKQVR